MQKKGLTVIVCAAAASVALGAAFGIASAKRDDPGGKTVIPEISVTDNIEAQASDESETINFFSVVTGITEQVKESLNSTVTAAGTSLNETSENGTTAAGSSTAAASATTSAAGSRASTTAKTTRAPSTTSAPSTAHASSGGKIQNYKYAYAGFEPCYAEVGGSKWNLLLVNRNYILPDDYTPTLADAVTNGDSNGQRLDYRVAPHYNEMYVAAKKDGIILTPVSGYRSISRQRNNFENKIEYYIDQGYSKTQATQMAARRILPPGTSEHNAGMAMDIVTADSTAGFQYSAEYKWLDAHAADYGFILRYPEDKQDVTEIIYEPWHWRYVGVDAARAMKRSGQCLEEYLGVQ